MFGEDFSFLAGVTGCTPKQTIPSPSMAHFRGGRAAVDMEAYPDIEAFFADLAKVYRRGDRRPGVARLPLPPA